MKKINDSQNKAQSGKIPMIVPYFLSTLTSSAILTIAGYLEICILGSGENAVADLAAYAAIATVQAWITAIAYFVAMGVGCAVSQSEEVVKQKKVSGIGLAIGAAFGLGFVVISLFLKQDTMYYLGADETTVRQAFVGVRRLLFASPGLILSHIFGTIFRNMGKKISSAVGLSFMGILQLAVTMVLIYFGVGDLSAVVWGLVVGEILSVQIFLIMWIIFLKKYKKSELSTCIEVKVKEVAVEIFKAGMPSLARQGGISAGLWMTNVVSSYYGRYAQSVMTAANRFMTLPFAVIIAVCQAYQPIASGTKEQKEERKEEYLTARRFGLWMTILVVLGALITGEGILNLIPGRLPGKNTLLVILGSQIMVLPAVMYSQQVITCFQVEKDWKMGSVLALLRNALVFVPVLWLLEKCFGIWGVFVAQSVTDLLILPVFAKIFKKKSAF